MSIFQNTCKPEGLGGKFMVNMMNQGHAPMAKWGFGYLSVGVDHSILDVGCGGGANVRELLKKAPRGTVKGLDYSPVSVEKSRSVNRDAIHAGRCEILQGNVMELPFPDASFDLVTAFETIYFWPDLAQSFAQIFRVLRQGGSFLICNETDGHDPKMDKWTKIVDGMTIYTAEELEKLLLAAGFTCIEIHGNDQHWLCMIAHKE